MTLPREALEKAMSLAAAEGRKWLGSTSPNPPVGAVALDIKGNVLAIAAHHKAGEAHAEAVLIEDCRKRGIQGRIDTLCVTLEPCNHQGRTPPCVEAIIDAGIENVVFGTNDPNPQVKGGGEAALRTTGINVTAGIGEQECRQLMHAFAFSMRSHRPYITIKRAFTRDGSMLPPIGQKTFTSPESLRFAHRLRKKSDAILSGSSTILSDKPAFTVRHVKDFPDKRRWLAILDRRRRVSKAYIEEAKTRGLDVVIYDAITEAISDLTDKGVRDILVEAGPSVSQSILDSGLWVQSVTIRQAPPDQIDAIFNPKAELPFDPHEFSWDHFLPQE